MRSLARLEDYGMLPDETGDDVGFWHPAVRFSYFGPRGRKNAPETYSSKSRKTARPRAVRTSAKSRAICCPARARAGSGIAKSS